jgi:hypothetical protein
MVPLKPVLANSQVCNELSPTSNLPEKLRCVGPGLVTPFLGKSIKLRFDGLHVNGNIVDNFAKEFVIHGVLSYVPDNTLDKSESAKEAPQYHFVVFGKFIHADGCVFAGNISLRS